MAAELAFRPSAGRRHYVAEQLIELAKRIGQRWLNGTGFAERQG